MKSLISAEEKRAFFMKLLETTAFKSRGYVHFMSTMLKRVNLENVHVVMDVTSIADSATFPVLQSEGSGKFVHGGKSVSLDDLFGNILGSYYDYYDLYVKIDMEKDHPMYMDMLSILETNEELVKEESDKWMSEIDLVIAKSTMTAELSRLTLAIDEALDAKDEKLFAELSAKYLEVVKELEGVENMEADRQSKTDTPSNPTHYF